ncbi:MAG: hypothetical protein LBU79_08780, partial [Planctomycetota bacterium]|nr:hypothetical protein [Planctomycetota bacterium]
MTTSQPTPEHSVPRKSHFLHGLGVAALVFLAFVALLHLSTRQSLPRETNTPKTRPTPADTIPPLPEVSPVIIDLSPDEIYPLTVPLPQPIDREAVENQLLHLLATQIAFGEYNEAKDTLAIFARSSPPSAHLLASLLAGIETAALPKILSPISPPVNVNSNPETPGPEKSLAFPDKRENVAIRPEPGDATPALSTDPVAQPDTPPVTQAQPPLSDRETGEREEWDNEDKTTPLILATPGVTSDTTPAFSTDPVAQLDTPPVTPTQLPLADREADATESRDSGDKEATPPILDAPSEARNAIPDLATDPGEPDTPPVTQAQLPLADREADGTESRDSGDKEATPPILDAPSEARNAIPDLATDPGVQPDTPPVTQAQLPLADREADATESRDSGDKEATPPILDAPSEARNAIPDLATDP